MLNATRHALMIITYCLLPFYDRSPQPSIHELLPIQSQQLPDRYSCDSLSLSLYQCPLKLYAY
jgi:hypothetical protein